MDARYIQVDEEGLFHIGTDPVVDKVAGQALLNNLKQSEEHGQWVTELMGSKTIVESFDQPIVARNLRREGEKWSLILNYGLEIEFSPKTLKLDSWDRFHGSTESGVTFVFSRAAQAEFFNLVDEFDDDSVTIGGEKLPTPPLYQTSPQLDESKFWTDIYQSKAEEGKLAPWDFDGVNPILGDVLPQLKIPKSKVLILGGGAGHEADFFASKGHFAVSVDFSEEASRLGQEKYGHNENIKFETKDIFKLGKEYNQAFDLVFEQTCFCAVDPARRDELVKVWVDSLAHGGHLLGVFFVHPQYDHIPFGATEWELKKRLSPYFDFLYWTRWRKSEGKRFAKELVVYARKKMG